MENYYEVLGVNPGADLKDVKSAFRRQAKKHHPDLAGAGKNAVHESTGTRASDAAMRLLLDAYRMLSDPARRRAYDRSLKRVAMEEGGFDYHRFLKERIHDPESQAKLVVYDLLHDLEDEALEMYEKAKAFGDFRLERWLERGEAMDTEFCIAEEYEKRGKWLKSYTMYKKLIRMETEKPWFRYFFEVLALRFRTVVLMKLPGILDEEDYLDRLEEAAELELSARDTAQFLRKKAEVHLRRRENAEAIHCIYRVAELEPRLAGLATLRRRAGIGIERGNTLSK